ncbi:cytochrome Cbb3 [Cupriavidus sp. SK-3]|uniref:cytochrome c-550 PedF n=1 Tax=unclassified Cupriavidus TaxID=2640874 RepID=UPI0004502768|nr:cytochrome c-550 PedF [Cupriavidus sp. SK-3]KDP88283.1 cytochrome Cbb3 [Cupriavidus sp. SK-3]
MKTPRCTLALIAICTLLAGGLPQSASAHGDVTPQAVDTKTLPQLGEEWRPDNPYRTGGAQQEALRIGSSAYNQNCARCHGLEAVSGGIAPDLRKLDSDCASLANAKKKQECMGEVSQYFTTTVRKGRTRDGRVYMPPFDGVLSQEAVWSIKTYLESRHE